MANPNIVSVTSILGKTDYLIPAGTTPLVLLPNAASSGNVLKINQIVAANADYLRKRGSFPDNLIVRVSAANVDGASAVDTTVAIYSNGAVAAGSAPSGGTAYPIASTVSVPADSSLIVTDKTTAIYLNEGHSISVTSGTASKIAYTISYEIITA